MKIWINAFLISIPFVRQWVWDMTYQMQKEQRKCVRQRNDNTNAILSVIERNEWIDCWFISNRLGIPYKTVGPRVNELHRDGLIDRKLDGRKYLMKRKGVIA